MTETPTTPAEAGQDPELNESGAAQQDPAELFDPSAHKVDEVNDYLAQAHPDEARRVLELEAAGQNRKTVVYSPAAEAAEATAPPSVEDQLGGADPYEMVRARTAGENAVEYTTTRVAALSAGSTILDKPGVDAYGSPYPTKTVLELRREAEQDPYAGQPGGVTDTTKEN